MKQQLFSMILAFLLAFTGFNLVDFFLGVPDAAACDIPDVSAVNLAGDRILLWMACKKAACRFAARGWVSHCCGESKAFAVFHRARKISLFLRSAQAFFSPMPAAASIRGLSFLAPAGQRSRQRMQEMHRLLSVVRGSSSGMAPTGHF